MYLIDPLGNAHYPWRPQPLLASPFPVPFQGIDNVTVQDVVNSQALRTSGPPSSDYANFDHVNNVERVDVDYGPAGDWTVAVIGRRVDGAQNFSIAHDANVGSDLELDELLQLNYRARTVGPSAVQAVWREWRVGEELAGVDDSGDRITGFAFQTSGRVAWSWRDDESILALPPNQTGARGTAKERSCLRMGSIRSIRSARWSSAPRFRTLAGCTGIFSIRFMRRGLDGNLGHVAVRPRACQAFPFKGSECVYCPRPYFRCVRKSAKCLPCKISKLSCP